jgi:hypothetical protein
MDNLNNKPNPKGSYAYNTMNRKENTTPSGANLISFDTGYKHIIPSGLETEIQNNLKGLKYE